jgi:hypothetical protein
MMAHLKVRNFFGFFLDGSASWFMLDIYTLLMDL